MKRAVAAVVALIGVVAVLVLAATATKRIPENHQGIRMTRSGNIARYEPGRHFVWPFSGPLFIYPTGKVGRRFPPEGVYEARTSTGEKAGVALTLEMEVQENSGEDIYREFGGDLWRGLSDLVKETVEVEAARWPSEGKAPEEFGDAIVEQLRPALGKAGIRVVGQRVDAFDPKAGHTAAGLVDAAPRPLRKIVFIGVDGGDWEVMRPMMEKGHLPNFKKIVEKGATGDLRSIEPILSPLVWTTIATGKLPEEHGILSFTLVDQKTGEQLPITRMSRKVDALWNILGERGRTVDIIGWLASYPAEDINGLMVTDRAGYLAYAGGGDSGVLAPDVISPADRAGVVAGLVVKSETLEYDDFRRILDIDRDTFEKEKVIAFDKIQPINNLIMLYVTARTYHNIAKHLLTTNQPDFLGVYYELCDAVGHLFMSYAPPRSEWIDERDYEKYKDVMLNTYAFQDRMLGELMGLCDDETVIMIASDHGFKSGPNRPRLSSEIRDGHAPFWHQINGIVACYGNGIRRGYKLEGASVLDILPTILALEGIPQARDMPGKVLIDAFEDSLASRVDKTVVATLESGRPREAAEITASPADKEVLKKLEALGYITPMNPNDYNNLGQRFQQQGEHKKAIDQFKKALAINPNFPGALNNIGVCYGKIGEYSLAEQALQKALSLKKDDVYAMNNLAIMYMETSRFDTAREYAEMAVRTEPSYANGHLTLGSVLATLGNLDRAEQEFARALELDPTNRRAQMNLEKVRSEKSRGAGSHPGG